RMYCTQASVVIVNPAGTRSAPSTRVISATFAPLPPNSSRMSLEPSVKSYTHRSIRRRSYPPHGQLARFVIGGWGKPLVTRRWLTCRSNVLAVGSRAVLERPLGNVGSRVVLERPPGNVDSRAVLERPPEETPSRWLDW